MDLVFWSCSGWFSVVLADLVVDCWLDCVACGFVFVMLCLVG